MCLWVFYKGPYRHDDDDDDDDEGRPDGTIKAGPNHFGCVVDG